MFPLLHKSASEGTSNGRCLRRHSPLQMRVKLRWMSWKFFWFAWWPLMWTTTDWVVIGFHSCALSLHRKHKSWILSHLCAAATSNECHHAGERPNSAGE